MDEPTSNGFDPTEAICAVLARAESPYKIAMSASRRGDLCKTRNRDRFVRRMECERKCGGSYFLQRRSLSAEIVVRVTCTEQVSRIRQHAFQALTAHRYSPAVVIRTVTHRIRLLATPSS